MFARVQLRPILARPPSMRSDTMTYEPVCFQGGGDGSCLRFPVGEFLAGPFSNPVDIRQVLVNRSLDDWPLANVSYGRWGVHPCCHPPDVAWASVEGPLHGDVDRDPSGNGRSCVVVARSLGISGGET